MIEILQDTSQFLRQISSVDENPIEVSSTLLQDIDNAALAVKEELHGIFAWPSVFGRMLTKSQTWIYKSGI